MGTNMSVATITAKKTIVDPLNREVQYIKTLLDGTAYGYRPRNIRQWVSRVNMAHQVVRNKWFGGGATIHRKVVVNEKTAVGLGQLANKVEQCVIGDGVSDLESAFKTLLRRINLNLPKYFEAYGLAEDDIRKPALEKCRGMSTSRHVLGYCDRVGLPAHTKCEVSNALSYYFREFERCTIGKKDFATYYATLSVDPLAFFNLGSFDCDDGSCFGLGGERLSRYYTGLLQESFVFLLSGDPISKFDKENEAFCRAICFVNSKGRRTSVTGTNFYLRGMSHATVDAIWASTMCDVFKIPMPKFHDFGEQEIPAITDCEDEEFYTNGDSILVTNTAHEDQFLHPYATPFRFSWDDFRFENEDKDDYYR